VGDRPPTLADLPSLTYTQQVLKEAMRLYPPAWFIMRQANEALMIGGEMIPRKAILFAFPYATQRDERWFIEPEHFLPERWEADLEKTLPKGAYFPFGMGPRICIGNGFAMMEAPLLLATIARRFRIELRSEARPVKATGTLGFEKPVQVRLHARQAG
jgi:cytochrome P450